MRKSTASVYFLLQNRIYSGIIMNLLKHIIHKHYRCCKNMALLLNRFYNAKHLWLLCVRHCKELHCVLKCFFSVTAQQKGSNELFGDGSSKLCAYFASWFIKWCKYSSARRTKSYVRTTTAKVLLMHLLSMHY